MIVYVHVGLFLSFFFCCYDTITSTLPIEANSVETAEDLIVMQTLLCQSVDRCAATARNKSIPCSMLPEAYPFETEQRLELLKTNYLRDALRSVTVWWPFVALSLLQF